MVETNKFRSLLRYGLICALIAYFLRSIYFMYRQYESFVSIQMIDDISSQIDNDEYRDINDEIIENIQNIEDQFGMISAAL